LGRKRGVAGEGRKRKKHPSAAGLKKETRNRSLHWRRERGKEDIRYVKKKGDYPVTF